MKKWILISLIAVALLMIILGILFVRASPAAAKLIINRGTVQVDSGNGWIEAENSMLLKEGYSVKTLADSKATILFFESSVLRMDANTEIKLDFANHTSISMSQKTGQTWTRLLKMSGISDYEIETPDAVATVRGTAFAVLLENGTEIDVLTGIVNARTENSSLDIDANNSASISKNKLEKKMLKRNSWIDENDLADIEHIKQLKARLKSKYSNHIGLAKSLMKANDEDVEKHLDDFVEGRLSIKKSLDEGKIPGALVPLIPEELKKY